MRVVIKCLIIKWQQVLLLCPRQGEETAERFYFNGRVVFNKRGMKSLNGGVQMGWRWL